MQILTEYATNYTKLSEGFRGNRLATAETKFVLFRAAGQKPSGMKEVTVATREKPTIVFDSNFVLDDSKILEFIEFCRKWARQLQDVVGRISLKFMYGNDGYLHGQRAEFMWQGTVFVQLYPCKVAPRGETLQYARDFLKDNLRGTNANGGYYLLDRLWEELFQPNLKAVIKRDLDQLELLSFNLDKVSLRNPETTATE